jgi:hypothetical protein
VHCPERIDTYLSGTEAGAGCAGQEYLTLPRDLQHAVREDVRLSFPDGASSKPFVIKMEVLVGSGRKSARKICSAIK